MKSNYILERINNIFNDILGDEDINLTLDSTADDVEDWDSLVHIQLIVAIENSFNVKFTSTEVEQFNCIGDIVKSITSKS